MQRNPDIACWGICMDLSVRGIVNLSDSLPIINDGARFLQDNYAWIEESPFAGGHAASDGRQGHSGRC